MTLMARLRRTLSGHKTAPAPDHSTAGKRAGLTEDQRASWERFGFVILPAFFASDDLHALRRELDQLWQERRADDRGLVIDVFIDTPNERRMRFRDAPDEARMVPYKLNDLYLASALVKETVLDPDLLTILDSLLDGEPVVCNSLTFERGSQQRFHFDTFYMPPLVENKMLATWIALEDCSAAAGPLRYYPGSHKIAPYRFSDGRLNASPDEMGDFDEYIDKSPCALHRGDHLAFRGVISVRMTITSGGGARYRFLDSELKVVRCESAAAAKSNVQVVDVGPRRARHDKSAHLREERSTVIVRQRGYRVDS